MPNGYHSGEISAIDSESDARIIRKITDIDNSRFGKLNPVWFASDNTEEKFIPGFSVKEIANLYPSATVYGNGNISDWSERNLIPFMVKAIQQNQKEIKELKKQIETFEKQISKMRRRIDEA